MIDLQVLRDDPDAVRRSQISRGADPAAVDTLLAALETRRAATTAADTLRAEANAASQAVRGASADDRPAAIERAKQLKAQVEGSEAARDAADAALTVAHKSIDNIVEAEVPPGGEDDFIVREVVGTIPTFDFPVKDHVALGVGLAALDIERGAKVSGSRFAFLTGVGALLELALVRMATEHALAAGFTPVIPPVLVKPSAMEGTGFLGAHSAEVYKLAEDDLYLVGTSEVPLAAMHAGEILPDAPLSYAAFSSCFRREAGSYGKDTVGLIRVHQFDKVEMFVWCDPADAREQHQRLLAAEKAFLSALELPFHVIDVAAGDLGSSAARKFDCEAWIPSQGKYRELTSTSNCTTFQARRLNVRRRTPDGPAPVATLNGTLCAVGRTIVAVLENHQMADGSVRVPAALAQYLGREVLTPA